jgi:FkbM family methyltransferase
MVISLDKLIDVYNLKIRGVIHIGAHFGEEYPMYVKHGIEDMLFFEPIKSNYNMLIDFLPKNEKIKTFNFALGNFSGSQEMFRETWNHGQSCSLLEPKLHLTQYPHIKFDDKEMVSVFRLDDVEFNRSLYNMINIDVQGYELEVFKGAFKTLNHIDIIYTEVNRDEVYKDCAKVWEIDSFLEEYGFYRVETDWIGKTWGDALYLKR